MERGEILSLVTRGMTYKEVGAAIYLSERTVKYHMGEILSRLQLKNRRQAEAYARKKGLWMFRKRFWVFS